MRTAMRNLSEAQVKEEQAKRLTERKRLGESLVRGLVQRPYFGKGIEEAFHKYPDRVMNLAFAVKNVEEHLADLTEAQISSTLGTTPENVLRVLRLGYLNTCRQDAFWEMGLATAHDVFFYLEPKYRKTLRGATAGQTMYESKAWRSASDEGEWTSAETVDGSVKNFTFAPSAAEVPLTAYTVKIYNGNNLVANDNGKGQIKGTDIDGTDVAGTVNYATGVGSVTFNKDRQLPEDVFLIIGTLLPLHVTDKLELPGRNTEFGVASYGDMQILNKGYAEVLTIQNA